MLELNLLKVTNHGDPIKNITDSGINVTLSGILIVFAMLVLLVVILILFGAVMSGVSKSPKKEKKETPKPVKKAEPSSAPVVKSVSDDSEDVIAVISAAVAMMYEGTGITPVIRSVRPAQKGVRSAWATAGIMNNTRSF